MGKPPLAATLTWQGDLRFEASSGKNSLVLDGNSAVGASPMQTLAFSVAGCMAMDIVDVVRKGRHPLRGLEAQFNGARAEDHPHRFVAVQLHFVIHGDVPRPAVERAIALSRDKYCSVYASLRPDIELVTSFEVKP